MRTHVLTGAAAGIGRSLAERLVERGDRVVALVRSQPRADDLRADLPGLASVWVADLADLDALPAVAAGIAAGLERVDSLLHVAGVVDLATVAETDWAQWRAQLDVNLTAPAILTQAFLGALRAAHGTVLVVNSGAGLFAHPTWGGYAASKFGVRAFADALRGEEPDLRVTTVYPGRTATAMQRKVHAQEGREYDAARWIAPGTVADAILHVLDLPPGATITELTLKPR